MGSIIIIIIKISLLPKYKKGIFSVIVYMCSPM